MSPTPSGCRSPHYLRDLLCARERQLSEERNRERWLRVRLFRGGGFTTVPEAAD